MTRSAYLAFLLVCTCVFMSGGCGGSSSSSFVDDYTTENANASWTGAWVASSGSATVRAESSDYSLTIRNIAAVFDSCDVEDEQGTAHMTALIILDGALYLPVFFENLTLSTDRTGAASWTAQTPHGTLSITMTDEGKAQFSGAITYFDYECEFSASVSKAEGISSALKPENMLDGTWKYNEARAGGYRYANGEMAALLPRYITVCFNDTDASSTVATTAGYIEMPVLESGDAGTGNNMFMQFIDTESSCRLDNFYGSIYKMSNASNRAGISSLIFIQSETQIYMLMSWLQPDGQICILLPLTKVQESQDNNIAEVLSRKWSATRGGGVMTPSADTSMRVNLQLVSCDMTFSEVQASNGRGTAKIDVTGTFSSPARTVNLNYEGLAITLEELGINLWRAVTEKGSQFYVSMLSESEAMVIADIVYDGAEQCLLTAVLSASE
ncbi:MAG: hypothetical protein IJR85_03990 [Synergistaceae bacterium]|nr:hypothetical protein [Synergistaceae bacterium]